MKRLALMILIAVIVCVCGSCSVTGSDYSAYLAAPKVTGDMGKIADAFYDYAGDNILLSYPKRGDYLSAFVLEDIDGDGTKEAIIFYTESSVEKGVAPIHINIVDKTENGWASVADVVTVSNEVDMVAFSDLSGNGTKEMLVGMTSISKNENQLSLYSFTNGQLSLVVQENYTDFILCNLTDNHPDDLLVINLKTTEKEATAKLYTFMSNELVLNGTVYLDGNVTGYAKLQQAKVGDKPAVYIDAYKGTTSMITDIVYVEDGKIVNPFVSNAHTENEFTLRSSTETCRDFDGDGNIDIPFTRLLPGFELRVSSERAYLTVWREFDGALFKDKYCGYINYNDGYMIKYPAEWTDTVTITRDSSSHLLTFGVYDPILRVVSSELVRIKRYSVDDFEQLDQSIFIELARQDTYVYVARIVNTTSEYSIDEQTLKSMFSLI